MENIIHKSLSQAVPYSAYRQRIAEVLKKAKHAEAGEVDPLIHYTILNETRMDRLEKTVKLDDEAIEKLKNLTEPVTWLVISEGWCGDAAQIVPILQKMADASPMITLKIVFRDEDEDLMNLFLTNGAKSIPKLIVLDGNNKVMAHWGPRPQGAVDLINRHKAEKGAIDEEAKTELQLWYLHDKGRSTVAEVLDVMGM